MPHATPVRATAAFTGTTPTGTIAWAGAALRVADGAGDAADEEGSERSKTPPTASAPTNRAATAAATRAVNTERRRCSPRTSRSQHELAVAEVPEGRDEVDRTDQLLTSWLVTEAITSLSADHRAVLLECYYRGSSVAQAAHRLGVPEGTVKSRTHYALRALRLALQEMGVGA